MAGLLAADVDAALAHHFHHVAIAHARAVQLDIAGFEETFQPQIGHDGCHDAAALQPAGRAPGFGDQRKHLVAVDQLAAFVAQNHAVGVAIQRHAEIGAMRQHLAAQMLRMRAAALAIDVGAVWRNADRYDFGTEFAQHRGRHAIGRTMRAIHHHAHAIQRQSAGETCLGDFDIPSGGIFQPAGAPQMRRRRQP